MFRSEEGDQIRREEIEKENKRKPNRHDPTREKIKITIKLMLKLEKENVVMLAYVRTRDELE